MRARAWPLVVLWSACATAPRTPQSALDQLAASAGAHLSGEVAALGDPLVLNREDFVWAAAASPDGRRVALVRLGPKNYHLSVYALAPLKLLSDAAINPLELDVEALAWAPDGQTIAVVSRDASVRFFDVASLAWRGGYLTDEPLVSVAFHPSGRAVAVGSSKGLVTVLEFPELRFSSEVRAHAEEVRALAFAPDGRLFTGGWDQSINVYSSAEVRAPGGSARLHFERKGGYLQLRGTVGNRASAVFALDARLPFGVVLNTAFAAAAGIDGSLAKQTVSLPTSYGTTQAPVVNGQTVSFKALRLQNVEVAICDACVPPQVQGVLGQALLDHYSLVLDEQSGEAVLTAKEAPPAPSEPSLQLTPIARHHFEGQVNDLTLDARGTVLGVAFSREKGRRTREVYEGEKRRIVLPADEWNCAARVDAATGQVLDKQLMHRGVVSTAGISPDGRLLASGGWDNTVKLGSLSRKFGWSVRQVRFTADGRWLTVAAWTPQNPLGDKQSDPSALVYEVVYAAPAVER